jgi:FMN phosphatase YigB (HAD superfamily)
MLWFSEANLDTALAETLYALDRDPVAHPIYEDVPETLQRLKTLGIKVAIVSDIHFDLRPEFALCGIDGFVDAYVLSFEHGRPKARSAHLHAGARTLGRFSVRCAHSR